MFCINPVYVLRRDAAGKLKQGADGLHYDVVPCGHCLACRIERSKTWAIRLMLETLSWKDCCFVTLTYSPETIPMVANGWRLPFTLCKRDFQLFMKRLRKELYRLGRGKIKYYCVGEYGDHTFRPHYHVIFFGLGLADKELIVNAWQLGIVDIGDVTLASCNYVAGYVQKKLYGDVSDEVYGNRLPPYSAMSKGLGKEYFLTHYEELMDFGYILYRDKHISLPRYFFKVMEKECPELSRDLSRFKHHRQVLAKESLKREYQNLGISDPYLIEEFEERKRRAKARNLEILNKLKERSKI